jgi:hypothetical protein
MEIGLQNQFNVGLIPTLLSCYWKVSITGNAAVLKTAVRVTAFAGSSPAPSALSTESASWRSRQAWLTEVLTKASIACRSVIEGGHYNT